ncbi:hypothetical protein KRE43_12135 [Elizabethkingia meningoseptica]|uniref:hypothetical protein n=1 Tax=Elizabethkingia TaxID=308865 RepID=UPI001908CFCE|nr:MULTISPECIES: hypothetical protein [Elizabethkingia]MCT3927005.1 hypothetical protein [Elizabethkingia anophelis]MCT4101609.1 hypothetical protein [Elizabethkingia anophelis]MCT4166129.1 hypothetical protein [Elizabethkingia anophelis]MDE5447464.1 hypothetical protein [Elizabethkingia meningoseptica]MDE5481723.1 hypothetical protein [Elizabethkingia meningoseptica]
MEKEERIFIRIQKSRKENWKKLCSKKGISLSSLIIDSVENRIFNDERRMVMAFIEKQGNVFFKIETNINQVARIVNGQKFISEKLLEDFSNTLSEIEKLKKEQNMIFSRIYSMLGK